MNRDVYIILTVNSWIVLTLLEGGCPIHSRWTKYIPDGILSISGKKKKKKRFNKGDKPYKTWKIKVVLNAFKGRDGQIQTGGDILEKTKMAIVFLRNSDTDPLSKQCDHSGPFAHRGKSVRPSVKYVDVKYHCQDLLTEFSGSAHMGNYMKWMLESQYVRITV